MPYFKSFYFETHGLKNRPAIIFLHGFMGDSKSWQEIIDILSKDFYCVSIDLPGHGRTKADDSLYNLVKCAEQVEALPNDLKLPKFNLVGYSMGGRLALHIALNSSGKLNKLVMESSSPGLKTEQERIERCKLDELLAQELAKSSLREFVEKWYDQPIFESLKRNPKRFESMIMKRLDNDPLGLAKSLRLMGTGVQKSLWEKLPELNVPTLLIVGELDRKFREIAGQMSKINNSINVNTIKDAGHNVHFERPKQYAAALREFLI